MALPSYHPGKGEGPPPRRLAYCLAPTTCLLRTSLALPSYRPLTGGGPRRAPGCEELPHAKLGRLSPRPCTVSVQYWVLNWAYRGPSVRHLGTCLACAVRATDALRVPSRLADVPRAGGLYFRIPYTEDPCTSARLCRLSSVAVPCAACPPLAVSWGSGDSPTPDRARPRIKFHCIGYRA